MNSDTPRTDKEAYFTGESYAEKDEVVDADFARELERENNRLRASIGAIHYHACRKSSGNIESLSILRSIATEAEGCIPELASLKPRSDG